MWKGFAKASDLDRARFEKDMKLPAAPNRYVMYFTPRSGSSWLTDIAERTRQLSIPGECFNPNFLPDMTRAMNATNIDEYIDILRRRRNTRGVFGFQITHHQMNAVFKSRGDFLDRFRADKSFWLIREDIVLQAISLHKMQITQLSHAPQISHSDIAKQDKTFPYNAREIKRWLNHILQAELGSEKLFAEAGIKPFRMSYEVNTSLRPARVLNAMGHHLGLDHMKGLKLKTAHRKIGTGTNELYAERFREEMREYMIEVNETRAKMLSKVKRLVQKPRAEPEPGKA